MNCISTTGRSPMCAAPAPAPVNPPSEIGVSITARLSEVVEEAARRLEGAPVDSDILPHEKHALVPLHLLEERLADRLEESDRLPPLGLPQMLGLRSRHRTSKMGLRTAGIGLRMAGPGRGRRSTGVDLAGCSRDLPERLRRHAPGGLPGGPPAGMDDLVPAPPPKPGPDRRGRFGSAQGGPSPRPLSTPLSTPLPAPRSDARSGSRAESGPASLPSGARGG